MSHPILYSFRRCPYAMRARMSLNISKIDFEHRDILLKNKPAEMLEVSPKGTVPVLILSNGEILDESLDIMNWALQQNDPEGWLNADMQATHNLISQNDDLFKKNLDRYKYPARYPDEDCSNAESICYDFLENLNIQLKDKKYLFGETRTLADISLFPFIRQFSCVDLEKFKGKDLPHLHAWREQLLNSDLFQEIMEKQELWISPTAD